MNINYTTQSPARTVVQFKRDLKSLIDNPKELLIFIDGSLKPKQKEKQENGEVFTPMELVFEMLDNLDRHYIAENGKSIFTEKEFKWGDIAGCGQGNFSVGVYLKLMEGLKPEIPDTGVRKKHILEKMLYMAESNKKNVLVCRQIFDVNQSYRLNLYEGNALELSPDVEWNIEKFDVILGNPPFNTGGIRSNNKKNFSEKKYETIWTRFVEKSFGLLKPSGYLAFIQPLVWLRKRHSLHEDMLNRHIIWLKLWDGAKSKVAINAWIPISLFVLQNTVNSQSKKTEVIGEIKRAKLVTTGYEYLDKRYTIPVACHGILSKLTKFIEKNRCSLVYNTKTVTSTGTQVKVPISYTPEDLWAIDTYTLREGILVKKTSKMHPDANKKKLVIASKTSFVGAFIDDGRLGLTGTYKIYILGDNLELLLKIINFKISRILAYCATYSVAYLDKEVCNFIPDLRMLGITDITEDEFYALVGLTKQEIDQLQKL